MEDCGGESPPLGYPSPSLEYPPIVAASTAIEVQPSYLALTKKVTAIFLQFPKIDSLVSIQMSGICVKARGPPLTKPAKVGFALVETPQ